MAKRKLSKKINKKKLSKKVFTKKSYEVPATQGMLFEFREEMKMSMSSLNSKIDSLELKMDSRFKSMDSRFKSMDSRFDKILSEVHRIALMVEDQNARNKYVLDGYTSLNDRLEKVEKKVFEENM